ncbi:hypothetical protein QCA50_008808 [Cerrena zonata]|uniref:Uncharacterized protein n=1 Tax=Cerrena zonata TaxID=2478898 RepID=A0AAW0GBS5_9APHY
MAAATDLQAFILLEMTTWVCLRHRHKRTYWWGYLSFYDWNNVYCRSVLLNLIDLASSALARSRLANSSSRLLASLLSKSFDPHVSSSHEQRRIPLPSLSLPGSYPMFSTSPPWDVHTHHRN